MSGYLVIGLGRFGKSVARTLYNHNKTVLAIDINEDIVQQIIDDEIVNEAIVLDATIENDLKAVINDDFDTAFVCIGENIQASILITLILKELGIKTVVSKAKTKIQGKVLKKVGATSVVYPEEAMGEKIAIKIIQPNMTEHLKFSDKYGIFEFKTPESFEGKSLGELDLRNKYEMNIIGIKVGKEETNFTPKPSTIIEKDNMLLVIANYDKISLLSKLIEKV